MCRSLERIARWDGAALHHAPDKTQHLPSDKNCILALEIANEPLCYQRNRTLRSARRVETTQNSAAGKNQARKELTRHPTAFELKRSKKIRKQLSERVENQAKGALTSLPISQLFVHFYTSVTQPHNPQPQLSIPREDRRSFMSIRKAVTQQSRREVKPQCASFQRHFPVSRNVGVPTGGEGGGEKNISLWISVEATILFSCKTTN
jgi:hypothetical protein